MTEDNRVPEHRHGRCDSTCPSEAHGCLCCRACEVERNSDRVERGDV